jgi:hypothetical protein
VLLACQGKLRLAPSGHIIDMHAALSLASAREHDLAVLSELLPAAEAPASGAGAAWLCRQTAAERKGASLVVAAHRCRDRSAFLGRCATTLLSNILTPGWPVLTP